MNKTLFYIFASIYLIAILYLAWSTPISPHEAKIFYSEDDIVNFLMHSGYDLLGGFFGLRLFFIIIGFISILLYFQMSRVYMSKKSDVYLSTAIYMLLPGIITALVLANISIVVIPLVLLYILAYSREWFWPQALLMFFIFLIHDASVIFFVAILLYALIHKKITLTLLSGFFLSLFIWIDRGVEIGGRPSGHFADMFGLYAALFSPLVFIYFFYTMYRILLREDKNILWYISFVALLASLILSVRQRIIVTDFAPYVIISVVLMLDTFNKSLRIRLPEYQKWYRVGFYIVISVLMITSLTTIFHKALFSLMKNPKKHFAARIYEPYWLSSRLKKQNIECYDAPNIRIANQLYFYGIKQCQK